MRIIYWIMLMMISTAASAWTQPIYRCGNTYSDEPCSGGKQIDILPTEGAHSLSGKKRESYEVKRKKQRTELYRALEIINGIPGEELMRRTEEYEHYEKGRIKIYKDSKPKN